jgi:hypothetical protein
MDVLVAARARWASSTVWPIAAVRYALMSSRTAWFFGVSGNRSRLAVATATLALGGPKNLPIAYSNEGVSQISRPIAYAIREVVVARKFLP